MDFLKRVLRLLPLLLISPLLLVLSAGALCVTDLLTRRRPLSKSRPASIDGATVVIPNWNGRDLLEKYLPSVIEALAGNPRNEIIVVDNGSTDGSAAFLREQFPEIKVLALDKNLGFGAGSNAGFRAASNDIVVLLNSDMRVERGFLAPLLEGFRDENVFAVACQIFFSDPAKRREETGLTQARWENGGLRVRHREDPGIDCLFPCFYGGGGSCAFDRHKFLELGGFDSLLQPFYLEDTDLGYMAWKRGWKVLYQPRSVVYHEHRGTIGKRFTEQQIQSVLQKNYILFCWKNIHEWPRLGGHFAFLFAGAILSLVFGDSPERPNLPGWWRAFRQLPAAIRSRRAARRLAAIDDTEAFRRPLGGYFRDRFGIDGTTDSRLRVLFVSPYPVDPPVHGGGVFMYQTIRELAKISDLHLVIMLDYPHEEAAHQELKRSVGSAEFLVRPEGRTKQLGAISPHAVTEFANGDLEWLIHRQIFLKKIDVLQLEYMPLGQYAGEYRNIPSILFEHDIYFQSVARGLRQTHGFFKKLLYRFEYVRALRYELRMLPRVDRVQVCSRENGDYLLSFLPKLGGKIDPDLRAGIDTRRYQFQTEGRAPNTMLFLGSFRHVPNQEALTWFTRKVLPLVLEKQPEARLVVIGSDPPPRHALPDLGGAIELVGFVDDVLAPLAKYAVFVCPILSGSGMRVKLLEAFAAGIPVVSTRVGAEGLAEQDGTVCALADDPAEFAGKILRLFEQPEEAKALARRARAKVEAERDMRDMTRKLELSYRQAVGDKRAGKRASLR